MTPDYDSAARPARPLEELLDVVANRHLLLALTARNVTVRYKRSWFGVAWTMVQPATLLLVLTVVFGQAFAPQASSYALYLAPGLILWQFFAQTTTIIVVEVASGVELWRRVRMPKTALAIAATGSGLLNLGLAMLVLIACAAVLQVPLGAALLTLPLVVALTAIFALGIGLTIAAAATYFPDTAELYQALLIPWMFVTPVIYPRAILPLQVERAVSLNPMALFVDACRRPIVDNAAAPAGALGLMALIAAGSLLVGWLVYTRCADDIPYRG
jgi:ABC-type polysaccharide/polyol phosphate export permease